LIDRQPEILRSDSHRPGDPLGRHGRELFLAFHKAALASGGTDYGAPGARSYHPGYAAFVLDPDGNNIEAVYHGPAQRSAHSVLITF
jgi:hypothetical protein